MLFLDAFSYCLFSMCFRLFFCYLCIFLMFLCFLRNWHYGCCASTLTIKNWILLLLLLLLLQACLYAVIISFSMSLMGSLDSSVSVVTSLRTSLSGERNFSVFRNVQTMGPAKPPIWWVQRDFSLGIKRPACEAARSTLSDAEVKNEWSCISTLPICLHAVRTDNLTFTFPWLLLTHTTFTQESFLSGVTIWRDAPAT